MIQSEAVSVKNTVFPVRQYIETSREVPSENGIDFCCLSSASLDDLIGGR